MKSGDFFDIILKIIMVFLAVLVIVWTLQLLFGGSPTTEELLIGIVFLISGLILHNNREIGIIKNDCKHNFLNIKNSFNSIKKDMDLTKKKLKI